MRATVNFELNVPFRVSTHPDRVVAHCGILDVVAEGPTRETAIERLVEALQLFVETCYISGTLETVLKDAGFVQGGPDDDLPDAEQLKVPFSLVAQRGRGEARPS